MKKDNGVMRWPVVKTLLDDKTYWINWYLSIDMSKPVGEMRRYIRKHVLSFNAGYKHFKVTDVAIWPGIENHIHYRDTKAWLRIARACSKENLYYWLPIAVSGSTIHLMTPETLHAIRSKKECDRYLLGLFAYEQPIASLNHGYYFDLKYWFDETHYRIPNGISFFSTVAEKKWKQEFEPAFGGIIKPLPKPVENPVEALGFLKKAYNMWGRDYLKLLSKKQMVCFLNWTGSNTWFYCGFAATKQSMGLIPFNRCNMLVEVNNQDYSIAYSEARGVSRSGNAPWGTMVGGVRWKYWNIYLKDTDRPFFEDCKQYGESMNVPGWLIFIPLVIAWAGGARQFAYEIEPVQISKNMGVRQAIQSFYDFLGETREPMDPETKIALLKGDAYFSWDIPGYENGMSEDINPLQRYYNGRNAGKISYIRPPITSIFYPRIVASKEWYDNIFSGNPYGEIDILPSHSPDGVLANYDTIIVFEWNCMNEEFHEKLLQYVRNGGTLFISAGHLFSQEEGRIDWKNPSRNSFYRNGDLTKLCGLVLSGGARKFRKATLSLKDNKDRIFTELGRKKVERIELYNVRNIVKKARVVIATEKQIPVCVCNRIGRGRVYTVLGPSYFSAMGDYAIDSFTELARFNRKNLSYLLENITHEEEMDLIVYRDFQKLRATLINYWIRHDMTPKITLKGHPGYRRYLQKILVYDSEGCVTHLEMPSRKLRRFESPITLLSRSIGSVEYEKRESQEIKLVHVVRVPSLVAHESFSLQYGPVTVTMIKKKSCQWVEKERLLQVEIDECPGKWDFSVRIENSHGKIRSQKRIRINSQKNGRVLIVDKILGEVFKGDKVIITGRKQSH